MYIHQLKKWPDLTWDEASIIAPLSEIRHLQGRMLGKMESLGFNLQEEATLAMLTEDVVKTSEIEGEKLNRENVRSSLASKLGIEIGGILKKDRNAEGIVNIMLDATKNFRKPLTRERLFGWHSALFPTGHSNIYKINVGGWRTEESGPMQVVSGAYGKEKIHFEAPSFDRLESEMKIFLEWFNKKNDIDPVIKSALAHFWFVTIHPFDDGNGRIARAIADMQLARSENSPQRFYSMSSQIQFDRKGYYNILEESQHDSLDITPWIQWYLKCLNKAINSSDKILELVLSKARFFDKHTHTSFNERQNIVINKLMDGFEGKMTTSKWAKIAKCSQDTALRDITDLINKSVLVKNDSGGRSTSYDLVLD